MRTLPVELTTEFSKDFMCEKHLFVMGFSTPQYWTDFGQNIYYGGRWYLSKDITFDSLELSMNPKIDTTTLNIDDVDRRLTKIILSDDIVGEQVEIYVVGLDKNIQVLNVPALLFMGYCDSSARPIGSKKFAITVYNHMIKWKMMTPVRISSPTCQWDFKKGPDAVISTDSATVTCVKNHVGDVTNKPRTGANWATYWTAGGSGGVTWLEGDWYLQGTCRYSGAETWCDRSWERCLALGNTIHFEGRRWLTNLQDKKIWWGTSADAVVRAYLSRKH